MPEWSGSSAPLALCQRSLECVRGATSDSWGVCEFLSGSGLGREPHPGSSIPPRSASKSRNLQQVAAGRTTQGLQCLAANTDLIQELVQWGTSEPPPPSPGWRCARTGIAVVVTTLMLRMRKVPTVNSCDSIISTEAWNICIAANKKKTGHANQNSSCFHVRVHSKKDMETLLFCPFCFFSFCFFFLAYLMEEVTKERQTQNISWDFFFFFSFYKNYIMLKLNLIIIFEIFL